MVSESLRKASDPAVTAWLTRHDAELALPTVTIAELAFGIGKIRPDQHAATLGERLGAWRHRFADRIFPLNETAALAYGQIMSAALSLGRPMSAPDGMIAAIVRVNGGKAGDEESGGFHDDGSGTHLAVGVLGTAAGGRGLTPPDIASR